MDGLAADADDLLQETSLVLWEKFGQFRSGTDFYAWACKIAYFSVCNYRRRHVIATLFIDDEVLALLDADLVSAGDEIDGELKALSECF